MDLFIALPLLLLVGLLIAVFSGRSEPDPKQERPQAIYLSIVAFVTLAIALGAGFAMLSGLVGLTDSHSGKGGWFGYSGDCEFEGESPFSGPTRFQIMDDDCVIDEGRAKENHDDDVRNIVEGVIVLAVVGAVRKFHIDALRSLNGRSDGPGKRVYQRYLYAACFMAIALALGSGTYALGRVPGLIATDTFQVPDRGVALRDIALYGLFALYATTVFRRHWSRRDGGTLLTPITPASAPPAPPPVAEPAPVAKKAPAKKAPAKKAAR